MDAQVTGTKAALPARGRSAGAGNHNSRPGEIPLGRWLLLGCTALGGILAGCGGGGSSSKPTVTLSLNSKLHRSRRERNANLVVDQRHVVHGQRRVERHRSHERHGDGDTNRRRQRHLHPELHRLRRDGQQLGNSDGQRASRALGEHLR